MISCLCYVIIHLLNDQIEQGGLSVRKSFALLIALIVILSSTFAQAAYMVESEEELYDALQFMYPGCPVYIDKDMLFMYVYEILEDGTAKIVKAVGSNKAPSVPESIDGIPVTAIGTEAYTYYSYNDLIIPEGVREIESRAFYTVNINNRVYLPSTLEKTGTFPFSGAFSSISGEMVIDENNPHFAIQKNCLVDLDEGRLIQYLANDRVEDYEIPDGIRIIDEFAFLNAQIDNILIPEGVLEIRREAFMGEFKSIRLPASLTSIAPHAFHSVNSIQLAPDSSRFAVEDGVLFDREESRLILVTRECEDELYQIPDGIRIIDDYAFWYSSAIKVYFPSSIEQFSAAAFPIVGGKYVVFNPDPQWYRLEDGFICSADGSRLIYYFRELDPETITVPEGVREIGDFALAGLYNLKHIELPSTIEKIGEAAFANDWSLEDIHIPSSVLSIGESAFSRCVSLTKLVIPMNTIHLGKSLFRHDENITVLVYKDSYAESFMNYGLYLDLQWDSPVSIETLPANNAE